MLCPSHLIKFGKEWNYQLLLQTLVLKAPLQGPLTFLQRLSEEYFTNIRIKMKLLSKRLYTCQYPNIMLHSETVQQNVHSLHCEQTVSRLHFCFIPDAYGNSLLDTNG
jgi:hypothetical protein